MFNDIKAFHEKFGIDYNGPPRLLDPTIQQFRLTCLLEELTEYSNAITAGDHEKMFDALIDLVYFALGTAYLHGFPFEEGWRRVQEANMKKIRVENKNDSKRNSPIDVKKPNDWEPPILSDLVGK